MSNYPDKLHIVAFDVPCPANYGGVIDIYYRVKCLVDAGVRIHLHCYQYGRSRSKQLEKLCERVDYYPRRTFVNPFYGKLPYIVNSRNSTELLENLCMDKAPIVFEGLHCTYHLASLLLKDRVKVVRTHNIEHHYYQHLELVENKYFKKYFFRIEAEKLKKHQGVLKFADLIAAISPSDQRYFSKRFDRVMYLPAFHENNKPIYPGRKGEFVLYHGNLGVPENYEAATQLVNHVFAHLKVRCIIAGNNPPKELRRIIEKHEHIELRSEVTSSYITNLIELAHVNVLHTNQSTGIKLKLLNSLYRGKFIVVNPLMVEETGLEDLCIIATDYPQMLKQIKSQLRREFTEEEYSQRISRLDLHFNPIQNAESLLQEIGHISEQTEQLLLGQN